MGPSPAEGADPWGQQHHRGLLYQQLKPCTETGTRGIFPGSSQQINLLSIEANTLCPRLLLHTLSKFRVAEPARVDVQEVKLAI